MDKSKEQFEKAWAERKFVFGQTVSIKDVAEEFWNKARTSLVVELPNKSVIPGFMPDDYDNGFNDAIDECKKSVSAAEITVKE